MSPKTANYPLWQLFSWSCLTVVVRLHCNTNLYSHLLLFIKMNTALKALFQQLQVLVFLSFHVTSTITKNWQWMSINSYKRERDKFGFIGLAPRPSKIRQTKRTSKKCISITQNMVNHDSLIREPLNMAQKYPRGYFFTLYRYILCAICVPGTDISCALYVNLVHIYPLPKRKASPVESFESKRKKNTKNTPPFY